MKFQLWFETGFKTHDNENVRNKKSDAQVGRVNTFHILQTIRKGPLNFKICMKRPLRFSNF
jgi:hypothetical protein